MMMFETVLEEVGSFGRFQILTIILLASHRITMPMHFLLNVFTAALPSHHCDISTLDDGVHFQNLTHEQRLAVSIPVGDDGGMKSCEMFVEPQFQLLSNGSNSTNLPTVQCQSGWVYDRSTFTSTLATEWDLVCERKQLAKATSTIFFIGVATASLVFGFFCDKFGRKNALLVAYIIGFVFGISSAFSNSYTMFAVLRFFTGFGITGFDMTTIVLCIEWVDVGHRSFTGVMMSQAWSAGNMLLAGFAYLVNDWRMLTITVTAPLGFALLSWWWIPESARWLLTSGRVDKAVFYLNRCAHINKKPKSSLKLKLQTLSSAKIQEKQQQNNSYYHLIKTPKMRRLTLATGVVWFGVSMAFFAISLNISGFEMNMYLTHFAYAAIEVPANFVSTFLLNAIGRKKCQSGALLLTGACVAINIFIPKGLWHVRAIVAIIGKGLAEISSLTVTVYTTELFPTVLR
ncbi:solute carrier family 22 member 7-like isoform X2 [Thalassophryne amazonica]|nr:solute carrier family 22 member 7-like isoform X2 [Thalassophryne amazonica]